LLPPHLRLLFDFQDDEQDRAQAEIRGQRSTRHASNLTAGTLDMRTVREQMLADGDLSDAQFEALELRDGRLENGLPIEVLLYQGNPLLKGIDPAEPDLVLAKRLLVGAMQAVADATNVQAKRQAEQALAVLQHLLKPKPPDALQQQQAGEEKPGEKPQPGAEDEDGDQAPDAQEREDTDEEEHPVVGTAQYAQKMADIYLDTEFMRSMYTVDSEGNIYFVGGRPTGMQVPESVKQQAAKVTPTGAPLPVWDSPTVDITPEDVAAALAEWDARVPDAAGLLLAKKAEDSGD
jgi:hypothetical protein